MTSKKFLFTSESVTEGHPDKVCDQISDAILDEFLTKDPQSRVAAETTATTGMVLVCGEITSNCYVDIPQIVRNTVRNIGYVGQAGVVRVRMPHDGVKPEELNGPVICYKEEHND